MATGIDLTISAFRHVAEVKLSPQSPSLIIQPNVRKTFSLKIAYGLVADIAGFQAQISRQKSSSSPCLTWRCIHKVAPSNGNILMFRKLDGI